MKRKIPIKDVRNKKSTLNYTTISDLPTDVLILIFKSFSPFERRSFLLVCKKWLEVGNDHFPQDSCIQLTEWLDYSRFGPLYTTFASRRRMKMKRQFSHLLIQYIPSDRCSIKKFSRFIDLIAGDVKHLRIKPLRKHSELIPPPSCRWINDEIFLKMVQLESLEVTWFWILGNLKLPKKLQTIKVNGNLDLFDLTCVRKRVAVQKFTCKSIEIYDISLITQFAPCISLELQNILKEIIGVSRMIKIKTDFNFCGDTKMTTANISGIKFHQWIATITPIINLENLKELNMNLSSPNLFVLDQLFGSEAFTHTGVTKLKVKGEFSNEFLDNFVVSFPNLEQLKIRQCSLSATHFSKICKGFPKLTELVLSDHYEIEFSQENIFSQDETVFALKDLEKLEKLVLDCYFVTELDNAVTYKWPNLPNLKELSLIGEPFGKFNKKLFKSIANNCPNVTSFKLFSRHNFVYNELLIPLLSAWGKNLTHLSLLGEGTTSRFSPALVNDLLVTKILKSCKKLKILTICDDAGFTMIQETKLFATLPSLETIFFEIPVSDSIDTAVKKTTRENFEALRPHLKGIFVKN